jgi:hypothetical protein
MLARGQAQWEELSLEAFAPQPFDVFEMPTIIGEKSKLVPTRGQADQLISADQRKCSE